MPVKVVTDSTADLPPGVAEELGITVVPEYLRFGNKSYRDGIDISHDEFYKRLTSSEVYPSTSQPSPDDFAGFYRELSKQADEIISIHISARLSGTCSSALQGAESAVGSKVSVVSSDSVSMGLGLTVMLAARLAKAGDNLAKISGEVKLAIANTYFYATLDTLKYLLKGGRIGKTKALLGSVLNVKPVLMIRGGELVPIGNMRTRTKGIDKVFELAKNTDDIDELAVVYSTTPDEANDLADRFRVFIDSSHVYQSQLCPAVGVHAGPGVIIAAFRKRAVRSG